MSGQGPYFGQAVWFRKWYQEDVPSAKQRFDGQAVRVFGVLNTVFEGKKYLVGEKFTYADLSFIPWDLTIKMFAPDLWEKCDVEKKHPDFAAWHNRLIERPSVKKIYAA